MHPPLLPWKRLLLTLLLSVSSVRSQDEEEDDATMHFSEPTTGRVAWVVEPEALPWIGSFDYIGSSSSFAASTVLMSVVDISTGKTLGECTTSAGRRTSAEGEEEWERFVWTLTSDSLQCNVSETNSSRIRFPLSTHSRSYSVRIQAARGPKCMRDLVVQNERPNGCPPRLERNAFTAHAFNCGCPHESSIVRPAFPLFQLRPTGQPPLSFSSLQTSATTAWTVSPCANFICENNGTCVVGADGAAKCLCPTGFVGERCEADVCRQLNCLNGGTCHVQAQGAICICPNNASGPRCEDLVPVTAVCQPNCENGGQCVRQENGYNLCECADGFVGINCNAVDVCHIYEQLCSVYGPNAQCEVDGESRGSVSPALVNATYDCLCPDPQTQQMVECMSLVLASSTPATTSAEAVQPGGFATAISPFAPPAPSAPPIFPFSNRPTFPVTDFTASPPTIQPQQPQRPSTSSFESAEETPSPLQPTPPPVPPMPFVPSTSPPSSNFPGSFSSFPSPSAPPFFPPQTSQTQAPSAPVDTFPTAQPTAQPAAPPSLPSNPETTPTTAATVPPFHLLPGEVQSTTFTPESEEEEMITEQTTTQLPTTENLSEEETEEATFPLSTPPPSAVPPLGVDFSKQPVVPTWSTLMPIPEEESEEHPSHEIDHVEETTTFVPTVPEVEVTEPRLPFWMISSTQVPGEEEGEEEENTETTAEEEEENTEPTTPITTSTTTTEPQSPGSESGQSSGSSSSAWIIAIIAVALLAILVGAVAMFTLRYVKRSRKLHGKYNPAREEHALSSAYAMPMTSVTKEERLI